MTIVCIICAALLYAKPHCQGFNNYDGKVTIVFTDEDAGKSYSVTDVMLVTCGKKYAAASVQSEVKNGVATVTLTFPYISKFSNPKVTLRINGKKAKFKVCQ